LDPLIYSRKRYSQTFHSQGSELYQIGSMLGSYCMV